MIVVEGIETCHVSAVVTEGLGHHTPLLPTLEGGRFIATMVSTSCTLARRVQSKTHVHTTNHQSITRIGHMFHEMFVH